MPLTAFQGEVLRLLAANRNPESHMAGGAVLNRSPDSPRYSGDFDIFHHLAESVLMAAEADTSVLKSSGFEVEWQIRQPSFQRARVSRYADELKLDWTCDSAFRFFPVQPDPEFGWCLHRADLATNKMLALAGRSEVRDFIDILYLHQSYLSVGALCWAACGKDPGFTPTSLLNYARRHAKVQPEELASGYLVHPPRPVEMKEAWFQAVEQAEQWFTRMPVADVGCLYLNAEGIPFTPDPTQPGFAEVQRHFGSVRGAWPTIR